MTPTPNLVELLPHRPPMLLLDSAEMGADGVLLARHVLPADDPVLDGHFPGFPVWPGALLLEAMAQTTAVYLLHQRQRLTDTEIPVLGAVDCRFLHPARPGEAVSFRTELVRRIDDMGLFSVEASAGGRVIARGRISAGIVPRDSFSTPGSGQA